MLNSSRKTVLKILILYVGTSAIFLCIGFYWIVEKETQNIIFSQMSSMRDTSFDIHTLVRKYNGDINKALPEIKKIAETPFAIYDRNNNLLYSNLDRNPNKQELKDGLYRVGDKIIANPEIMMRKGMTNHRPPPLKIFLENTTMDNKIILMRIKFTILFLLTLTAMAIIATILVKMFLKPLNEYISTLDMFIKDATHEINTPISVILMSIETLKKNNMELEEQKKIERIKVASLQLNKIYSDLVAHNFPHSIQTPITKLELHDILEERINFFTPFFHQKNLTINKTINKSSFNGSKEKIVILFDNLISNAIKYNSKDGSIDISLDNGILILKDQGKGIKTKNIKSIYERYTRYSSDSGGFGIGLFLVKKICDEYGIKINIDTSQQGTTFTLTWKTNQ